MTPEYLAGVTEEYAAWLNTLEPDQRNKHFRSAEYWDMWMPRSAPRCGICGSVAWELKWPDRIEYRCLEDSCRHEWVWKRD